MTLFQVKNLNKIFSGEEVDTHVLHDLNFTIEKGEFVSVMGPSGSGKSTLLHILGFLLSHTSGEYRFNGRCYEDYGSDEIARERNKGMGFVFQTFNLLPRQTVYENVILPLMYSEMPERQWRAQVEKVVDIVGLSHRIDFETHKLSGGEKQRTAMARALVNNPDVIFADEPTGNLDSESGKAVMAELQYLHENLGHTIILITHETSTAEHAERIIRIKDGRLESDIKVVSRRQAGAEFLK